jgi:hypothetical protein
LFFSLKYNPSEEDFDSIFTCRSGTRPGDDHSIYLRRAELPRTIQKIEARTFVDAIELTIRDQRALSQLPIHRYLVNYEQKDSPSTLEMLNITGEQNKYFVLN